MSSGKPKSGDRGAEEGSGGVVAVVGDKPVLRGAAHSVWIAPSSASRSRSARLRSSSNSFSCSSMNALLVCGGMGVKTRSV